MPLQKARLRISDYNKGRKNRIKDTEKNIRAVSLPLTSMVDMFSTLVVYLIFTSADLKDWVSVAQHVELPRAKAKWENPERAATIQITKEKVMGDDNLDLMTLEELRKAPFSVPRIKEYLKAQEDKNGYANVVADKSTPFGIIRKVMASVGDAGYKKVNLAVRPGGD